MSIRNEKGVSSRAGNKLLPLICQSKFVIYLFYETSSHVLRLVFIAKVPNIIT